MKKGGPCGPPFDFPAARRFSSRVFPIFRLAAFAAKVYKTLFSVRIQPRSVRAEPDPDCAEDSSMTFNPFNMLILFVIFLIPVVPTLWAIVDLPRRRFSRTRWKVIWFALVATLPVLGAIVYFAFVRRHTEPI